MKDVLPLRQVVNTDGHLTCMCVVYSYKILSFQIHPEDKCCVTQYRPNYTSAHKRSVAVKGWIGGHKTFLNFTTENNTFLHLTTGDTQKNLKTQRKLNMFQPAISEFWPIFVLVYHCMYVCMYAYISVYIYIELMSSVSEELQMGPTSQRNFRGEHSMHIFIHHLKTAKRGGPSPKRLTLKTGHLKWRPFSM